MRTLRLSVLRAPSPVVLAATLVTASACGGETTNDPQSYAGLGGTLASGGTSPSGGAPSGGAGLPPGTGGVVGTGGTVPAGCNPYDQILTFDLPLPPEGTPPSEVCATAGPVESGQAAQLELTPDPTNFRLLHGRITVSASVAPWLSEFPLVELVSGPYSLTVSAVRQEGNDYVFDAALPDSFKYSGPIFTRGGPTWMVFRITLLLKCPAGPTSVVTEVSMGACWDEQARSWGWRGDGPCTACYILGEGAAPPLPSPGGDCRLALSEVLDVGIQCVARVGSALVLMATSDSAERLSFDWQVSGGRLLLTDKDVAVWEPSGDAVAQVAAQSRHGVGVATFSL